jgi:predicted alpha/beta superfamily hydrolase
MKVLAGFAAGALLWSAMAVAVETPTPPAQTAADAAAEAAAAEVRTRLRVRDTSEATLTSKEGRQYRILVSAPQGPEPPGGFPVIYVLDGDAWFGAAVEIARMREWSRLPPAVIVGVAYPSRFFLDPARRSYDFTPPGSADPGMEGLALGGADEFLAFLNGTLKPWLHARHAVDPNRQILFGHSLGGLFALHAMFTAPESFNIYIAASPSIRFSRGIVMKGERAFLSNPARTSVRLLVTLGEFEGRPSPGQIADYRRYYTAHPEVIPGQTVDEAVAALFPPERNFDKTAETRTIVDRLVRGGVNAVFVEFAGEEHTSSAISALNRGVPFALRPEP